MRSSPRVVTFHEGEQSCDHGMHPGDGIACAADEGWRPIGTSGPPRHSADRFHGLGESGAIPPGTVETERGHAHHDELGVVLVDGVPGQPELVHHSRGVVLDQHVCCCEEAVEQVHAVLAAQVEGHAAFSDVDGVEDRTPLPPTIVGRSADAGQPHLVGAPYRLDLDDVGPERGEDVGGGRAGPPGSAVNDPDSGEGELPFLSCCPGRAGQLTAPSSAPRT